MSINDNHIDDLIGKYLAQEASAEEAAAVEAWLAQSDANRKYFSQFETIFARAATVKEWQHFDTDAAWNRVRSRLHEKSAGKTVTMPRQKSSLNLYWRIAATIIIVLGAGIFAYRMMFNSPRKTVEVVAGKRSEADTLPDGSGVYLNRETKLAYSFDKKKKTHRVKLNGEAYFNIHHEADKTFIVEAGDVLIKDIGTSFNVKAYPEANTIEVVVEEGKVMFYTEDNTGIYLQPGGKGIYHKATKTFTVEEAEPNITAYKTKFFIFSGDNLGMVVQSLNDVYDRKVVIPPHLKNCKLTVSFNNEEIGEIAQIIAETLGLTVKDRGTDIVLEGKSCGE